MRFKKRLITVLVFDICIVYLHAIEIAHWSVFGYLNRNGNLLACDSSLDDCGNLKGPGNICDKKEEGSRADQHGRGLGRPAVQFGAKS